MRALILVVATLLVGAACGDPEANTPSDAGPDATDGSTADAGGDTSDATTEDASTDTHDAETEADAGDDAGIEDAGVTYVSTNVIASITKQLSPDDENSPALLEIGTLTYYPVMFTNPRVVVPSGLFASSVEEVVSSRNCPRPGTGAPRCLQLFRVLVYPDAGTCKLDGAYQWTLDVTCAPGGDCDTIDPAFTSFSFTARHASENFCGETFDTPFDPFRPTGAVYSRLAPAQAGQPAEIKVYTTSALPYVLSAGSVTAPAGFTVQSFTLLDAQCPGAEQPSVCRQWWSLKLLPSEDTCSLAGTYGFTWGVGCAEGGNCDPEIETFSASAGVTHLDVCP